ncbi:hypothetical protein WBJ53_22525 [Spirosoma sp. SC4-14]|uniref:hypothetical protein n=1 Tax=Spirosoma sp. SC4-14 TaxID=3128900 RepID=UPI0030CEC151
MLKLSEKATEFEQLPFAEQATVIWRQGRPVATRHLPDFRLHLYAVDRFFVEMWVCRRRFVVTLFRVIPDTDELMPYIDEKVPVNLARRNVIGP